jgi:DNA gyrase subunit A
MGRNTQGVRIMRLDDEGNIAAVTRVANEEEEEA